MLLQRRRPTLKRRSPLSLNSNELTVYWAPEDFIQELKGELKQSSLKVIVQEDQFFLCEGNFEPMAWSESTWRKCRRIPVESISKAAKLLAEQTRFWAVRSLSHHRRAQLILDQVSALKNKPISFPEIPVKKIFGAFLLLSENEMIQSVQIEPLKDPNGPQFVEDPTLPSRAYLKLWEALSFSVDDLPKNKKCLEVGASPGGWTAVLRSLDCEVWAVDRSELSPSLMKDSKVHFLKKDAFSISPQDFPQIDWVFSDVICYPEKLFEWVQKWLTEKPAIKMVCTIKFQGPTDFEAVRKFKSIPNSRTLHLFNNKHELTWIKS